MFFFRVPHNKQKPKRTGGLFQFESDPHENDPIHERLGVLFKTGDLSILNREMTSDHWSGWFCFTCRVYCRRPCRMSMPRLMLNLLVRKIMQLGSGEVSTIARTTLG